MKMSTASSSQVTSPDPPNKAIIDPFDARSLQVQPVSYIDNDPPTEFFCMLRSHKEYLLFIPYLHRFDFDLKSSYYYSKRLLL
jgi:hypothetical protein